MPRSDRSVSDDEGGFGLGELMPREPSPPPPPFSFEDYDVPADVRALVGGRETVRVRLVGSHPLWGHYLWNTARVLTSYLLRHPSYFYSRRTLELGAGAGLPSLACALGGAARAVCTDYNEESLLDNIRFNAAANGAALDVVGHTWGMSVQPLLDVAREGTDGRYDLVILSDLMFNHSQHDALIKSLDATLSLALPAASSAGAATTDPSADPAVLPVSPTLDTPAPCALVFFTHHRPHLAAADMAFFPRLLARHPGRWAYARVAEEWAGAMFEHDRGDERVRGTVHGFRVWRV
ncbi:Protein N-terminal and lysine N-methyltransferase efm7 [Cryptotrichosporon argae]